MQSPVISWAIATWHFTALGICTNATPFFTLAAIAGTAAILCFMNNEQVFTLYVSAPVQTWRMFKLNVPANNLNDAIEKTNRLIDYGVDYCLEKEGQSIQIDEQPEEAVIKTIRGNGTHPAIYLENEVVIKDGMVDNCLSEPHDYDTERQQGFIWSITAGGKTAFNLFKKTQPVFGGEGFLVAIPTDEPIDCIFDSCPSNGDVFKHDGKKWEIIFCFHQ